MKTKIIPAINSQNFEDIKKKINLLKDLTSHFHLDIASLDFTGYSTWKNPEDLNKLPILELSFDLHLMISLKPQEILKWQKENVKTFILHLEASSNPDALLKLAKRTRRKIFFAWSPKVEFEFIEKYLNYVDGVLVLGVNPGRAGQIFLEETYQKIEFIKSKLSLKQKLMVDGGINKENFKKILSYELDYIVMASAIYNSENPKETYQWFLNQIKN
jgi:ribulose-phosphate 3-epimerase